MKKTIKIISAQRNVFSKTWLEPELKEALQALAAERGMKESPFIRWLILAGLRTMPDVKVTEN